MLGINLFWLELLHSWRQLCKKETIGKLQTYAFFLYQLENMHGSVPVLKGLIMSSSITGNNCEFLVRCTDGEVTMKHQKRVWDELVNFWAQSLPLCLFSFNFFPAPSRLMRRHSGRNYTPYPDAEQHAWTATFLYLCRGCLSPNWLARRHTTQ